MMIVVRTLNEFLELVNRHRPVLLSVTELIHKPGVCEVAVSGFSKLGDHIAVKAIFEEECRSNAEKEECEEIVFNKMRRYLLNHFGRVYEGVITE